MTAQFPGPVTESPAPSSTFSVQAKYRASEHLGFGAEVLFMETDAWRWQSDVLEASFAETRKIVAPGFKAFYSPIVGRHELVFNGGVSVFKQDAVEIAEDGEPSYPITSTKLDPYMTLGAEYHFYVGRHFGVGGEIQYYAGSNVPSQLLRYSASVSFRTNPPPER